MKKYNNPETFDNFTKVEGTMDKVTEVAQQNIEKALRNKDLGLVKNSNLPLGNPGAGSEAAQRGQDYGRGSGEPEADHVLAEHEAEDDPERNELRGGILVCGASHPEGRYVTGGAGSGTKY